ncbi:MAG: LysM peptidoglycan-binding domain-containing protein [Psychroserpens sp.]|uniref:lytic transglycosylase n=1 Tax=Psychroserpens sp. TaxID=2020870 RepID=UPI0030019DD4
MLKNFKLIATVLVLTALSYEAVAQTEKDVVLDGKPAKLNVKTGEVKLVELKTIKGKKIEKDTAKAKTIIQASLLANSYKTSKGDSTKIIVTNRPDTLSRNYRKVIDTSDHVKIAKLLVTSDNMTAIDSTEEKKAVELVKMTTSDKVEKATTFVYDTSSAAVEEENSTDYHKVEKGETLYYLSKLYNVTLTDLKKANNLETTLIKIGQYLYIRNFDKLDTTDVWIVSKGDTLYSIAKRNNTTVATIKSLNGLHSNLIKPGQKLQLK